MRKINENNEVIRYKTRQVAVFSQRSNIDYWGDMFSMVDEITVVFFNWSVWKSRHASYECSHNITVYFDDLNIIGTLEEILNAIECLMKEFEIERCRNLFFCLGMQIEHLANVIFVH